MKKFSRYKSEFFWRCFYYFLSFIFTFCALSWYFPFFVFFITQAFREENTMPSFIFTDIAEAFHTNISFSFAGSFVCSLFFCFYQFSCFFLPGLTKAEKNKSMLFGFLFFLFFLLSFFLSWKVFIPFFWKFFSAFEVKNVFLGIYFEPRVSKSLEFFFRIFFINSFLFCSLFLYFSFIFYDEQGFLTLKLLSFFNLYRNFFYYFLILLWSILCPTDLWSQIVGSIFFLLFFEFCLFLTYLIQNYQKIIKR